MVHVPVGVLMKRRNPVVVWLGLPLITLGLYHVVWYYRIHREMAEFDRRRNVPIAGPPLVVFLLGWTLIAPLISYYNCGRRIADAQHAARLPRTCSARIGMFLMCLGGLGTLYFQIELNKIHDVYGSAQAGSDVQVYY
jgi:hypothetical protein